MKRTGQPGDDSGTGLRMAVPLRVLMVSADPAECALIRGLFAEGARAGTPLGGISLDSAGDYRQAAILARDLDYAAILLGQDGGRALLQRACAERDLPGPFLLLADEAGPADADEAVAVGAADLLAKAGLTPLLLERAVRYAVALHAAQRRAAGLELVDTATELPSQPLFWELLSLAVRRARRNNDFLAVLMMHLDCLEEPSGKPGIDPQEAVLPLVAQRLKRILRASDTIARLDNGHLAVLVESMPRLEDIQTVAEKIIVASKGRYEAAGRILKLAVNVGIALFPTSAGDAGGLLQTAASAMLAARERGVDEFHFG
jgi:diguanylate cyclase (GGDEF)-like protein